MIYMRFNQNIEFRDGKVAIGHNIDMLFKVKSTTNYQKQCVIKSEKFSLN